jgi:hypothetical protein
MMKRHGHALGNGATNYPLGVCGAKEKRQIVALWGQRRKMMN